MNPEWRKMTKYNTILFAWAPKPYPAQSPLFLVKTIWEKKTKPGPHAAPLGPLHLQFSPPWQVTAEVGTAVVAVAAVQVNPQHLTCAACAAPLPKHGGGPWDLRESGRAYLKHCENSRENMIHHQFWGTLYSGKQMISTAKCSFWTEMVMLP